MKFTINISKEEFRNFNQFAIAKINNEPSVKMKLKVFNTVYLCLLAVFLLEMYSVYDTYSCYNYEHLNKAMVALGVWFFLAVVWQKIYMRLYVSAATVDNGTVLGKWEFEISELGITESNELCTSTFYWQSIKSVEKDKYNLYIFTDNHKALILPLSQINQDIETLLNQNLIAES